MAKVIRFIMEINNFDGPFSSVWRTFVASETLDEPVKGASVDEDKEPKMRATTGVPCPATDTMFGLALGAQPPSDSLKLKCKMRDELVNLPCKDLSSLEDGKYVFDSIIDFVYARMSLEFASQKDILLVRPHTAYLLGNLKDRKEVEFNGKSLDLKSYRMVFVPVNDNTDYMRFDGGKHWSLLVIHIAEDCSSCRFVHHDSVGGLNFSVAIKYVNVLKQLLPDAPPVIDALTPMQLIGPDCSLCVLALTKAICSWWVKKGRSGKSDCWVKEVNSKITGHTYADVRSKLREKLMEEMRSLSLATATAATIDCTKIIAAAPSLSTTKIADSGPSTAPAAQPLTAPPLKLKCTVQGEVVELFCKELTCLEDERHVVDSIINFVYARISLIFNCQEDLLLVRPMHPFLMGGGGMKTEAEVEVEAESLNLKSRSMVLVPVNGNMDTDGGRHWSLLVIQIAMDRSSCRFIHHDNLDGVNHNTAVRYADLFRRLLPEAPPVVEGPTPPVLNASDCGFCVLALTKAICRWWDESGRSGKSSCWFNEVNSKVTGHSFCRHEDQTEAEFNGGNASSCL